VESLISSQFAGEVEKWLLKVIIRLCGNFVVLEVFLTVKGHLLWLDLSILDIHLISAQHDWNAFAYTAPVHSVYTIDLEDVPKNLLGF
jgi:hypothetical protein